MLEPENARRGLRSQPDLVAESSRDMPVAVARFGYELRHATRAQGGYLRGQLTLALIIGFLAGVGTALLGLPYAVVLGVVPPDWQGYFDADQSAWSFGMISEATSS
jgi:hypothetical protein